MIRTWIAGVAAVGAVVAGAVVVSVGPGAAPLAASQDLVRFDSCKQLEQWYVAQAASEPKSSSPLLGDASSAKGAVRNAAVGNGATGTNVQEQGVDESDLSKTNGKIAAVVDGTTLRTYDVTGSSPRLLSTLPLGGAFTNEMLLVGDHAVLIANGGRRVVADGTSPKSDSGSTPGSAGPGIVGPGVGGFAPDRFTAQTTIATVDLSDPADPSIVSRRAVDGDMIAARDNDGVVRIMIRAPVGPLQQGPIENGSDPEGDLRSSPASDWVPKMYGAGKGPQPLVKCGDVRRPKQPSGVGMIAVLTFDPSAPDQLKTTGVATSGSLAYASAKRLYVATVAGSVGTRTASSTTHIHAFTLDGSNTAYLGSGKVDGVVPDRWAFSTFDGNLRVASTVGDLSSPTESIVTVLAERGNNLASIGHVGAMGKGEQIKAARWFGDRAVVVTFRQTDPLYTLDLSDPREPSVVGTLKIPGFSDYLHPVGGGVLLGVGQDATKAGQQTGSQVSTFDLSDLARPTRIATRPLGSGGYSPVEQESRAFTYLPDQRLAFIPVIGGEARSGAVAVVRVGADGTLDTVRSLATSGPIQRVRVMPVDGDRVAVVDGGTVTKIVDVSTL